MKFAGLSLFILLLFCGCHKKSNQVAPLQIIDTGLDIRINDVALLNDTAWILGGGIRDVSGYILLSRNHGANWQTYQSEFPKSIYSIKFRDALHGYAGGDFLHMWTTEDGGQTWNFYWLGNQVPFNGEDRPAIRDFAFMDDSNWYFCGGENLGEGVLYSSNNAGNSWEFKITGNEMRCMEKTSNNAIISGGHGAIWTMQASVNDATQSAFENDFITSSTLLNNGSILFCSYDGKIYSSNADGTSTTEILDGNRFFGKRINWNAIHNHEGNIVVCGNDGYFAESQGDGSSWTLSQLVDEPHLFSIDCFQNQWWAGGEHGKLYQIK